MFGSAEAGGLPSFTPVEIQVTVALAVPHSLIQMFIASLSGGICDATTIVPGGNDKQGQRLQTEKAKSETSDEV